MVSLKEREDAKSRIEAELLVEAFMGILEIRYGLKSSDIPEILEDLRWVRQSRNGLIRVQWSVALAILALAVSGLVMSLWEGVKMYVRR